MIKHDLKKLAISQSLLSPTSLPEAFKKLKFIQADPIRSPAHAQDLILHHRVKDYKVGDLEEKYSELGLEEDFLYAHGFMTKEVWSLLHPRSKVELTDFDKKVLEVVKELQIINPKDLVQHFGSQSEMNWWGGKSQATRMSLERLHYYGQIKISGREKGNRIYSYLNPEDSGLDPQERMEKLILTIVGILAPVSNVTLRQALHRVRGHFGPTQTAVKKLINEGQLKVEKIDGIEYLWPSSLEVENNISEEVRFLAPFDPVVWDRVRFEHLWGWAYRFEAYVPKAKRIRGYYAMPLLWRGEIIGWVNIDKMGNADIGFIFSRPKEKKFEVELEKEIERLKKFLRINE
jgi:uncharacterized protein YcaQ